MSVPYLFRVFGDPSYTTTEYQETRDKRRDQVALIHYPEPLFCLDYFVDQKSLYLSEVGCDNIEDLRVCIVKSSLLVLSSVFLIGSGSPVMAQYSRYSNPMGPGYLQKTNPMGSGYVQDRNPMGSGYYQKTNPMGSGYVQDRNPMGSGYVQDRNPMGPGYVQDKSILGF